MPDTLVKTKVMHLMRCSGTVSLAAAACSMDVLRVWGRWARSEDFSGQHCVESILYLVMNAELEWNTRPLSPQMTEAFDKISKQVCSLSEQIAHLQLSVAGMQQPLDSQMAANHGMLTASSSTKGGKPAQCQHVNRSPGLPSISISQFAGWVEQATDEIAVLSIK
ncbi:hypothetical protein WJX79_003107 [Trebouxia sp. C0005]